MPNLTPTPLNTPEDPELERLKKRLAREKKARKEAERVLEAKSRELYESNLQLKTASDSLERLLNAKSIQLQSLLDSVDHFAIINSDLSGYINVFNFGAEKIFEAKAIEVLFKRNIKALFTDTQSFEEISNDLLTKHKKSSQFESCLKTFLGNSFEGSITISIVLNEQGDPTGMLFIITDITEDKKRERELSQKNRDLQKLAEDFEEKAFEAMVASKAKSEFLATMSHEIRTPLNGINGMLQLLQDTDLQEEQLSYVKQIDSCSSTLLTIINNILDLSKLEAGKMQLEEVDFNIHDLIKETVDMLWVNAEEKGVSLRYVNDPALPPYLYGDAVRIRQVCLNLINNAIKFTSTGSIRIESHLLSVNPPEVRLKIRVIDTGIGIKPDETDRLFKEFSQADSSISRKFGGTGLGLSICKKLITAMNGQIAFKSDYGKGSTFWFELQLKVAKEPLAFNKEPKAKKKKTVKPLRILAADDNKVNLKVIDAFIKSEGHSCKLALNGRDAVAFAKNENFDLILMDMQMPVLDGLSATHEIRNFNTNIPIIALTANAFKSDREKCIEAGCSAFLTKPIQRENLFDMIYSLVSDDLNEQDKQDTDSELSPVGSEEIGLIDKPWIGELVKTIGKETVSDLLNKAHELGSKTLSDVEKHFRM